MTQKIPISMNDQEYKSAEELCKLLGMNTEVYGWFPKTVKFSINLAILLVNNIAESIPDMKESEIDLLLQTVKRAKIKSMMLKTAEKVINQAEKV